MFEFKTCNDDALPDDDREKVIAFIERENAADQSLDWLVKLRDTLAPVMRLPHDAKTTNMRELHQLIEAILACPNLNPRIVRLCFNTGRAYERGLLQKQYDGLVRSAQRVSKANARKSKARLDERQFRLVNQFITNRQEGVSEIEACRQAATQLRTGAFSRLPGLRVEITADALRKRRRK